jgi:DNA replication protein DnaC
MKRIEETLKKIAAATSKGNMQTSLSINSGDSHSISPGNPDCPFCAGLGFLREELPVNHPDFGKMTICTCRAEEVGANVFQRLYRISNLEAFKGMTFETFNPRGRVGLGDDQLKSLTYAHNQARLFSQDLKGWLMLIGDYGCGKTHLGAAIAHGVINRGIPTLFLTVPDLLDWLRYSYDSSETSFEQRFEEIRNIDLLVLDDLGTENATPWACEKLFQIINHRYTSRLPTVITTNLNAQDVEGRIKSRLKDPDLVTTVKITAPDYRSPITDSSHHHLSSLHLPTHNIQTFGSFSMRELEKMPRDQQASLETTFRIARDYAEKPRGWLVIMGDYWCGKTHLAAALGNYRVGLGETPMFVVVPDLLDHLRATFSPSSSVSYDHLFDEVRSAPLLILDDLGTQSATPWAREKLYQLFNYRYNAELPTVITTVLKLEDIDPRIRSRMLDARLCRLCAIIAPPYRRAPGNEKQRSAPRRAAGK